MCRYDGGIPSTSVLQSLCDTVLIVIYNVAHEYPAMAPLQVGCYAAGGYHVRLGSQRLRRNEMAGNTSDNTVSLTSFGRHWKA